MADESKPQRGAKPAAKAAPSPAAESKKSKDEAAAAKKLEAVKGAEDQDEEEDAREGDDAAPVKAKADKPKPKPSKAADDEGADDDDDADDNEEKGEKKAKLKARPRPKLDADLKRALDQRKAKSANRQEFHRQEWFRYQRLGTKWRYPQGIQSKMRRHWGTHADVVSIGHRGPKIARGLHPSGFKEVVVHNAEGLDGVDPASEAVRIAGSVGRQKREAIQKTARKRGIRVLNWKVWRD